MVEVLIFHHFDIAAWLHKPEALSFGATYTAIGCSRTQYRRDTRPKHVTVEPHPSPRTITLAQNIMSEEHTPSPPGTGGEPEAKRRKIRKGTRSCWECRS